jgi:hypothetical protein
MRKARPKNEYVSENQRATLHRIFCKKKNTEDREKDPPLNVSLTQGVQLEYLFELL